MSFLLQQLRERRTEAQASEANEYWALVERGASGAEVDPAEADEILAGAGLAVEDLERHVQLQTDLRDAEARAAETEKLKGQHRALNQELADHGATRREFLAKWEPEANELNRRVEAAAGAVQDARAAAGGEPLPHTEEVLPRIVRAQTLDELVPIERGFLFGREDAQV